LKENVDHNLDNCILGGPQKERRRSNLYVRLYEGNKIFLRKRDIFIPKGFITRGFEGK